MQQLGPIWGPGIDLGPKIRRDFTKFPKEKSKIPKIPKMYRILQPNDIRWINFKQATVMENILMETRKLGWIPDNLNCSI